MSTIAHLVKLHHDPWPWMTFRGHFKVTNVKIPYIFFMVWDKHVVTMKHYWEVDICLSESANKFDLGWPWRGHFKVTKVKMARIAYGQNVHRCSLSKSASWPLEVIWRSRMWKSPVSSWWCDVRDNHMVTVKHYSEVDIGLSESANKFDLGWPWRGRFKVTDLAPWVGHPSNSWASCFGYYLEFLLDTDIRFLWC